MQQPHRNIFTISLDTPFLRTLAYGLIERTGGYTPDLTRHLILLPTRRACRGLRDMFLHLSGGKPVLLPRLQTLGDVDQDELDLQIAGWQQIEQLSNIPPAMPALRRLILLSRLIRAKDPSIQMEQAFRLAKSLAVLIDRVHTEDLDFSRLQYLVPEDLSEHWQQTLEFLDIVSEAWPLILAESGFIDAAARRNLLMKALALSWQSSPPTYPVIAAGSTGSIPATGNLLDIISTLSQGAIILPGLDTDMTEENWESISDTHPQATMKNLLQRCKYERKNIPFWHPAALSACPPERRLLAREIMRPSTTIDEWMNIDSAPISAALDGITLLQSRNLAEEAHTIAVILREVLETPGKTAALVTPDRELARRVCSALRKWDIPVDDSAGTSLYLSPAGYFLDCIMLCIENNFRPVNLLNLLRHPLSRLADPDLIAKFDIVVARGPRPSPGLQGLYSRLRDTLEYNDPAFSALENLLQSLKTIFEPLHSFSLHAHSFRQGLEILSACAEKIAGGPEYLWIGEDGEVASSFLTQAMEAGDLMPVQEFTTFQNLLRQMMTDIPVRHPVLHPRLIILGQLEARMIETDVIILGSLNEGSWPAEPAHDPWLSRPMRQTFGLPSPERSIGLAAHDFAQALGAPKVFLTRSLKVEGAPTVPSRWLQRLETLLQSAGVPLNPATLYQDWARSLHQTNSTPCPAPRPSPCPPVSARPRRLSATWIERWTRNPYDLYVRKILRLQPFLPVDQDIDAAQRGTLVHAVMQDFLATYPDHMPPNAGRAFLDIARKKMSALSGESAEREYWWPRLERLADWVVTHEKEWRQNATPWLQEVEGRITIPYSGGEFLLTARADRIDRLKDGTAAIIDYKTGGVPSKNALLRSEDSQLPLEGLILRRGGYVNTVMKVGVLSFWKLLGGDNPGKPRHFPDPEQMIDNAEEGLKNLIEAYDNEVTPYVARPPRSGNRAYDIDKAISHLARTAEWGTAEAEEDTGDESP